MSRSPSTFPSKEIILKLNRDLKDAGSSAQIAAFKDYLNSLTDGVDARETEITLNKQVGFIHFQHKEYTDAIPYFEKVYNLIPVTERPMVYFFNLTLLIDAHRHSRNYDGAFAWFYIAVTNIRLASSPFDKLGIMARYVDLLHDSGQPFNHDYTAIIEEIITGLDLPPINSHSASDRVKTIQSLNKHWSRQLGALTLSKLSHNDRIKAYEVYKAECEIGWYRDYAQGVIDRLKSVE